jgi:hypothetical protein
VGTSKGHKLQAEEIAKKINAALALGQYRSAEKKESPLPCSGR